MSDDEDFMQESDEEQYVCSNTQGFITPANGDFARYDFEYEEDDDDESGDVDIENKYYNAKQLKLSSPEEAITEFLGMPALEQEKSEWGFKGLKQAIKLEFKLGKYEDVSCILS